MNSRLPSYLRSESDVKASSEYVPDPYLDSKCPILSAMLSMVEYEGEARTPATLILFCEDGRSKVLVNNKHQGTVGVATVDSFEDVFDTLEALLAKGELDFRKSKGNFRK